MAFSRKGLGESGFEPLAVTLVPGAGRGCPKSPIVFDGAHCGDGRQCVRKGSLSRRWIAGFAHCLECREIAAAFGEAAHQVQHTIDDAPRDVAAQCADEHHADVLTSRFRDAQRARESQDHDPSEQRLGDAIDRFQHPLGSAVGLAGHGGRSIPTLPSRGHGRPRLIPHRESQRRQPLVELDVLQDLPWASELQADDPRQR